MATGHEKVETNVPTPSDPTKVLPHLLATTVCDAIPDKNDNKNIKPAATLTPESTATDNNKQTPPMFYPPKTNNDVFEPKNIDNIALPQKINHLPLVTNTMTGNYVTVNHMMSNRAVVLLKMTNGACVFNLLTAAIEFALENNISPTIETFANYDDAMKCFQELNNVLPFKATSPQHNNNIVNHAHHLNPLNPTLHGTNHSAAHSMCNNTTTYSVDDSASNVKKFPSVNNESHKTR